MIYGLLDIPYEIFHFLSGINDNKPMSGAHLPVHHGFDYVGTNLPYSNVWECDESKVMGIRTNLQHSI